jgi:hypothetical protein
VGADPPEQFGSSSKVLTVSDLFFSIHCFYDEYVLISFEGGPGYTLYTAYSGVLLVAGGSGISYATSVLDDILQKHASGKSNVRVIEVVWSVTDPGKQKQAVSSASPSSS